MDDYGNELQGMSIFDFVDMMEPSWECVNARRTWEDDAWDFALLVFGLSIFVGGVLRRRATPGAVNYALGQAAGRVKSRS